MIVIKNNFEFCMYKMIAPATAIRVSIIMVSVAPERAELLDHVTIGGVSVAPDMASLTFPASLNREIISPTFLVPKKFIGSSITCL